MSENTHSVAIGAFIVGALLIAITIVVFLFDGGIGTHRERVLMVFDGSVKGLSVGAPVALRGVEIGQVSKINLVLNTESGAVTMMVVADLDSRNVQFHGTDEDNLTQRLVERGLRAQLNPQSLLTGLLYVHLDFFPSVAGSITEVDSPYAQIPTIPTELEKLSKQLEELDLIKTANDIREIATGLKILVANKYFQSLPEDLHTTLTSIETLSNDLRTAVTATNTRLDTVLVQTASTLATIDQALPPLVLNIEDKLNAFEGAISAFENTLHNVDALASPDSPLIYELHKTLQEVATASRAIELLARTLEEQPEALLRGKNEDSL